MPKPTPESETWESLAPKLGTTSRSLRTWRKMPGAPEEPQLEKWQAFVSEHQLNKGESPDLKALKVAIAQEDLRKKRRENQAGEGRLVAVEEVTAYLATLAAKWDQLLTQKLETELPARIVGKGIVEVRAEVRQLHDEIREANNAGISQWKPSGNV